MAGRAALLAAFAPRARLLLPLALAPEQRLRQDGTGRTEPGNPGFQSRVPGPQRLYLLAQPGDLLAQRFDRLVPIAQSPEGRGQQGTTGKLGLQPLLLDGGLPQDDSQIVDAPRQQSDEVHLVVVSRQLSAEQNGLAGQPAYCRLEALQPLQLAAQPAVLPVRLTGLPGQGIDFLAQHADRVLLPLRPFQRLAQPGALPGQRRLRCPFRLAQRCGLLAQRHEFVLLLLRPLQGFAQPGVLPRQRPGRVLPRCRCRRSLERLRVASRRRHGRIVPGLRGLQGVVQPDDFHTQRHHRAAPARLDAGFRKQLLQPRHFRLEEQRVLRRAADLLRLLDGRVELVPALVELPLQRTRTGTGGHLCLAQLFRARFRRVRPRPFRLRAGMRLFVQRRPVAGLQHRRRRGGRPDPVVRLGQRQCRPKILVAHRHARNDNRSPKALPDACARCSK